MLKAKVAEAQKRFEGKLDGFMVRAYVMLSEAPTTNIRILLTLALTSGTAIKYWTTSGGADQWQPSWEWLMFLAGMAGLDVLQYYNKRKSTFTPTELADADKIRAETNFIRNGSVVDADASPEELPNESEKG